MSILQTNRNAGLLVDVLRTNMVSKKFRIEDFVVMPDHVHLILTLDGEMTIERAVQSIKGGFSYRLKKEFAYAGEVWQRGFSEERVWNREAAVAFRKYIADNPVRAGLVRPGEEYPFTYTAFARRKLAAAKAGVQGDANGTTKVVP